MVVAACACGNDSWNNRQIRFSCKSCSLLVECIMSLTTYRADDGTHFFVCLLPLFPSHARAQALSHGQIPRVCDRVINAPCKVCPQTRRLFTVLNSLAAGFIRIGRKSATAEVLPQCRTLVSRKEREGRGVTAVVVHRPLRMEDHMCGSA